MFSLKFFFLLFGVAALACELRNYVLDCEVTAQFEGGTQFSCDKGLAYCCETFNVTASKAQTWYGCKGGVATSIRNSRIQAAYIAKYIPSDGLLGCPYVNDFYGRLYSNGVAKVSKGADVGQNDFDGDVDDDAEATATMGSQFCDYTVSGFEVTPEN